MLSGFWQSLQTASQGQASFLGTLTGSSIGLVALLLGALFNAHLNRKRDDRLRLEEQRVVATALHAELVGWRKRLQSNIDSVKADSEKWKSVPILSRPRLFPELIAKLGFLPSAIIESVVAAYDQADWYCTSLQQLKQTEAADKRSYRITPPVEYYGVLAVETVDIITQAITLLEPRSLVSARTWREMSWPERWRLLRGKDTTPAHVPERPSIFSWRNMTR
jgi:hypothetical protein